MPLYALDGTFGALFVGLVVANVLYGTSIVQAYYYYSTHNDSRALKYLVTTVMICDTINQALITHTVYTYAISNWGNEVVLTRLVWSLSVQNFFNSITEFLVQSFMTLRVWRLSDGNILLTSLVALFVLAELISVTIFTILELQYDTFDQLLFLEPLSLAINILSAVGDAVIAVSLCILLHRFRTGFERSDTVINQLMLFFINTGLITCLCAIASFVSYMAAQHTFVYVGFYFCIGRLYTNALLASLNVRKMIGDNVHSNPSNKVTLSLRAIPKDGSSSGSSNATALLEGKSVSV